MKLNEIVTWYQKKIGTCDKQQWEKTVEQKILDGFRSVTLKNAKLKTDLIDVDLVRGSTFPKAKPKQSLVTVIRLAILRYFFLPIYAQWWVKQTSPNTFAILLLMYITQMVTWAIYTFNIHRIGDGAGSGGGAEPAESITNTTTLIHDRKPDNNNESKHQAEEHIVSLSDLLIPMALSLLLSLIHSQIVATNTANGAKVKRRRFSNASQSAKHNRDPRVRRRKKLVKVRNQDFADSTAAVSAVTAVVPVSAQQQQRKPNATTKYQSSAEVLTKIITKMPQSLPSLECNTNSENDATVTCSNAESFNTTSGIVRNVYHPIHYTAAVADDVDTAATVPPSIKLTLDLSNIAIMQSSTAATADCCIDNSITNNNSNNSCTNSNNLIHKKRNVNWHLPLHNYAIETQEKQQQTSSQSSTSSSEMNSPNTTNLDGNAVSANIENAHAGCCNIDSSNSNNSTSNGSPNKTVRIDDCVQEFYNDLITRTDFLNSTSSSISSAVAATTCTTFANSPNVRRNIGEDDGFESLNGKSSSGEDNNSHSPLPTAVAIKNQLRLRLNATAENHPNGQTNQTAACYRRNVPSSIFNLDRSAPACSNHDAYQQTKKLPTHGKANASTEETEEEGDDGDGEIISSPNNTSNYNECTTSATEWLGVTTNSEECSYSSELELENSDDCKNNPLSDEDGYDLDFTPTTILNAHGTTDRISCTIWDQREVKKAQMSVLEISSCIIERVESMPEIYDYIYIGIGFSFLLSFIPSFCRLCEITISSAKSSEINYFDVPMLLWEKASFSTFTIFRFAFGQTQWERTVLIIGLMQRLCLTMILFIIFAVAERTFKQRFLYAKLFSHLTSSRRARKSNLPHFRLNKVRNIKTWLSVRSYLKKRGPQRSVDVIVSAAFIVTLLLLAFLSVEWLKDSVHLHSPLNLEALMWSTTIGIFLLRFMTLGNKIHHKYRSVSVLITEQINLYLQIEQKPKKKDELMVSNSVLKLAADLLKELESPFKISGLSANPYLFTTIKVVILSALSGVLSEMLGFKLKLHKIKIK